MSWLKGTPEILLEPGKIKLLEIKVKELEYRLNALEAMQYIVTLPTYWTVGLEKTSHSAVLQAILTYLKVSIIRKPEVPASVVLEKRK